MNSDRAPFERGNRRNWLPPSISETIPKSRKWRADSPCFGDPELLSSLKVPSWTGGSSIEWRDGGTVCWLALPGWDAF